MPRPDLSAVFRVRKAESSGEPVWLRVVRAGKLKVSTGKVTAVDPFISVDEKPFTQRVPNGSFPVELCVMRRGPKGRGRGDERIALARVLFPDKLVERWALAVRPGEDVERLLPGQAYGYGVDSGNGCFADAAASRSQERWSEALQAAMDATYKPTRAWGSIAAGEGSVVAFSSGYGDGVYPSYFGFDARGSIACLVTNFRSLAVAVPEIQRAPSAQRARIKSLLKDALTDKSWIYEPAVEGLARFGAAARDVLPRLVEHVLRGIAEHREDPSGVERMDQLGAIVGSVATGQPDVLDEVLARSERAKSDDARGALLHLFSRLRGPVLERVAPAIVNACAPSEPMPVRMAGLTLVTGYAPVAAAALPHALEATRRRELREQALKAVAALLGSGDEAARVDAAAVIRAV